MFSLIHEDNHLLVVEKAPGVLSQADGGAGDDLLTLLKADLKRRHRKPGEVFLGLVHRLDRPVGGVMVFARTSKAAARLAEQMRRRAIRKTYLAVVHGKPAAAATLEHHLLKDASRNLVKTVPPGTPGAKAAVLEYHRLASAEGLSLLRVVPATGRPHQIRVQLAAAGAPIFGDVKYGAPAAAAGLVALWAAALEFQHPTRGEPMRFTSPPPSPTEPWRRFKLDFRACIFAGNN